MEPSPAACATGGPSEVSDDSSSLSLVMHLRERRTGALDDRGEAISPILEEEPPDVTTDSILRGIGIDPDVERAMDRIFAASSPPRNVNGENVGLDFVGINQSNPYTPAVLSSAENMQEGSVASHNTAVSATTRSIFAIDDNAAGAVLNGSSNVLPGLVLGPGTVELSPFPVLPHFPFAASSSSVLPGLAATSDSMFKTIARVEYDELIRIRQQAEQNVQ